MTTTTPQRDVRFGPRDVTMTRDEHGVIYVRPVHPLGKYPAKLTEKLDYWAQKAPDRVFMGQRDWRRGDWRTLTYAQFRAAARNVAQALLRSQSFFGAPYRDSLRQRSGTRGARLRRVLRRHSVRADLDRVLAGLLRFRQAAVHLRSADAGAWSSSTVQRPFSKALEAVNAA